MLKLFSTKEKKSIKNWHSRAMVINLRTTKVTMITLKTPCDSNYEKETINENKVIATPVAILNDPNAMQELNVYHRSSPQGPMDDVETIQVEVHPL